MLLWAAAGDRRLSPRARKELQSSANRLFVSAVSAWEILLKVHARKLRLGQAVARFLDTAITENGLTALPISWEEVQRVDQLPAHHRDPFDRLLVAQSQVHGLAIMTSDANISRYAVDIIW